MYSRQEVRAIAELYWHLRERGLSSELCLNRMVDFSRGWDRLTDDEKRLVFRDVWLNEPGANCNLVLDEMVGFLNGE